ncbi:MAG TPA: lytic transglycosylase domain-containing protein [Bacteriovoracaceae bacterium]|nr:lytic transglycosylase domain-containing protein [Bacteriovoracaceae bacterium]
MRFYLLLTFLIFPAWAAPQQPKIVVTSHQAMLNSEKLQITRAEIVIAEHIVNMMKLIDKGYVNNDILNKLLAEVGKSKHFLAFNPWLQSVKNVSNLKSSTELIVACREYITPKEKLPLEKRMERMAGNFCRERALEAINRDIEKEKVISDTSTAFIQENLKFFLTKKNKKNFAFFLQSQASRPEILRKISQEVTTYSVRHEIVPSQEVLQDIEINEQITKLIQTKGFNPLQHQNVFYAEYGKLIEAGYRSLDPKGDAKPEESKIKEHFRFLKNYLELNHDHLPVGLCLTRLNDFAKAAFRAEFVDLSRDIFKFIIKKNNSEVMEDSLFYYIWTYLVVDDYKGALKLAKNHKLLGEKSLATDPRLKFWLARAHETQDEKAEAIMFYEYIVLHHPLNYYSIMSAKRLMILKPDSAAVGFYAASTAQLNPPLAFELKDFDDDHISSLVRLRAWSKIDNQKMVNLELKRLRNHSTPAMVVKHPTDKQSAVKSDLHLMNAKIIQEANHLATFRYLYVVMDKKEVNFSRALLEILYPKPYLEDLSSALKNDSLDPLVVLSLIRQESVFNPLARSPVGARGLMQLMPMTARRMKRGSERNLQNPKLNIEVGTKYFKGLIKRYDGNLVYVLSAYNAGETRVERWKNLYWDTDETILKNIEQIPFLETRNYVKLIFRNLFFYKLLLETKEPADSGELNKIFDVNLGFKR